MYQRRLKALIAALGICLMGIVGRLFQLQLVHGRYYEERAASQWVRPPLYRPALRGEIQDRRGTVLVRDETSFNVSVHYWMISRYKMISGEETIGREERWVGWCAGRLMRAAEREGNELTREQAVRIVDRRIDEFFDRLCELTGTPIEQVRRRCDEIADWVGRVKESVQRSNEDFAGDIHEETELHVVVRGLSAREAPRIRLKLDKMDWISRRTTPWAAVTFGRTRVVNPGKHHGKPIAHFIGRLRNVRWGSKETKIETEDELERYTVGEQVGYTGVERLCEKQLRGRKGLRRLDKEEILLDEIASVPGQDVRLTIDIDLQEFVYEELGKHVSLNDTAKAGAVVILDVPTRQILALVSFPSYNPAKFSGRNYYKRLREDQTREPLRFRAIAAVYPPGSTLKPLVALKALTSGRIRQETILGCQGALFPDKPGFGCYGGRSHGSIAISTAIKLSCNVFFYQVGQKIGYGPLHDWLHDEFAIGRPPGTGLIEESPGMLPAVTRTSRSNDAQSRTEARLLGVGQGKIAITPLQSANMVASIADGRWMAPTLVLGDRRARPSHPLRTSRAILDFVREAMRRVVNEKNQFGTGTGYNALESIRESGLVVAGKTGSAEAERKTIRYRLTWKDGQGRKQSEVVLAVNCNDFIADLCKSLPHLTPESIRRRKEEHFPAGPPKGRKHSHAWFICFAPFDSPAVAMSVVLEYGGAGGSNAAPVANEILRWIRENRPQYLHGGGGWRQ